MIESAIQLLVKAKWVFTTPEDLPLRAVTLVDKTRCKACRVDLQYALTPSVLYGCRVGGSLALGNAMLFIFDPRYDSLVASWRVRGSKGEARMEWVTPGHEEVDLSCEVSGYANAEL